MSELNSHLLIQIGDNATKNSKVIGNVRVSVLTDKLLRVEVSKTGEFSDFATQKVWHRDFCDPKYEITETEKYIIVKTESITANIDKKGNVKSVLLADGRCVKNFKKGNLKGTCRTLDCTVGAVKLDDGILSTSGVAILDDSDSLIYNNEGELCKNPIKNRDYYIFAYGFDYRQAVADFYKLSGQTPLIARFALGNWWSRYRAYTQDEYINLMDKFAQNDIPFTVATVDMDWHLVHGIDKKYRTSDMPPHESIGWTGYTWNDKLFPDYRQFLSDLHKRNLRVTLNLHPARGVRGYEVMYEDMAKAVGVDYKNEEPVAFDLTNPKFVNSYFDILHHPYEKEGVNFWWIDWQQGKKSNMQGLDPLYALNHYHTLDSARDKRGLILSRYAGIGSHRYPLGFSGDTNSSWSCLKFQPYFTANATNCGYSWWSHDIGGHHFGEKDDELYCRWIQFGVFSPILRLHSTQNDIMGKEPWNYSSVTEGIVKKYLQFRHAMIPFLYTMNRRTSKDGIGLIEPMYYSYPKDKRAYACKNCYIFGESLIASPITQKTDKRTLTASSKVFLPKGRWTDIFTGRVYDGDCLFEVNRDISYIPVFAKEGAIIPLADEKGNNSNNPKTLKIWAFSGNGEFVLYEDDGESNKYKNGEFAERKFAMIQNGSEQIFEILPATGDLSICSKRKFVICFKDIISFDKLDAILNGKPITIAMNKGEFVWCEIELDPTDNLQIKLIDTTKIDNGNLNENIVNIFARYQGINMIKTAKYAKFLNVKTKSDLRKAISKINKNCANKRLVSQLTELLNMKFDD